MGLRKEYSFTLIAIVFTFGFLLCGVSKANATAFSGSLPPPAEENAYLQIFGSFDRQLLSSYGKLDLLIDINPDTAIYKEIIFKTLPETYVFSGEFESGFNGELIPVTLELTYEITFRTNQSSQELAITPKQGGGYNIESFYTSHCNFQCYDFIITGAWTAIGPTETISGNFSHLIDGRNIRGIGADTTSDLDPTGYPTTSALVNFQWGGSTGGIPIPRIVEVTVDGALIIIDVNSANAMLRPTVIASLSLEPKIPAAIFNASQVTGDAPLSVNFFDESVGEIDTWEWEFGDGLESPYQNPTHTYTAAGTYTVILTITGLDGTDTKTRTNYITVNEPPAPPPPPPDTDGDGVIDPEDNCINEWNPDQADADMDNIGDACDIDELLIQMQDMNSTVISLTEQNAALQTQITNLSEAYNSMEQRIKDIEEGYSDHSHSYLTGSGSGHNNVQVLSGPAIYPASSEPIPSKK